MLDAIRPRTPWLVVVLLAGTVALGVTARSEAEPGCAMRGDPSLQLRLEVLRLRMVDAELAIQRALARLDRIAQREHGEQLGAPPRRCIYRRPIDGGPCAITCAPIARPPRAR